MAIVKVVKSGRTVRRAQPLISYMTNGEGHRPGVARYEGVVSTNGMPTTAGPNGWQNVAEAFAATRERFQNSRAQHEVHHVVLSFGPGELPDDETSTALEIARAFAAEAWPTRQTFGVAQRDGKGGKLHVHLAVGNLDMLTGKAARGDEMTWKRLAPVLDSTLLDRGMSQPSHMPRPGVVPEFKRRGHTHFEHHQILSGLDPRAAIIAAIEQARASATSIDEYIEMLAAQGISATLTAPHARKKYGAAEYVMRNVEGTETRFMGSQLGKGAGWSAVAKSVAENLAQHEVKEAAPVQGQDREAVAAASLDAAITKAGQDARADFLAAEADAAVESALLRLQPRAPRKKPAPQKLTPARAAYLRQKGVISKAKAREYGA